MANTTRRRKSSGTSGGGGSTAGKYASLEDMVLQAGVTAATVFWNRSRTNTDTWRFGELFIAPLVVYSTKPGTTQTVAKAAFVGSVADLLTAPTKKTAAIMSTPIREVDHW